MTETMKLYITENQCQCQPEETPEYQMDVRNERPLREMKQDLILYVTTHNI